MNYDILVSALSDDDGGGFIGIVPDLQGCMSDGETEQEAIKNTLEAIDDWIECQTQLGRKIPEPGTAAKRAKEDRARLVEAIMVLSEGYEGIDQRIEEIARELRDIKEILEHENSWRRFSTIIGTRKEKPLELGNA